MIEKIKSQHKDCYIVDLKNEILDRYPLMKLKRLNLRLSYEHFDGVILGISHSRHGILPYLMPGNWKNFSLSSQDIIRNVQTLYYAIERDVRFSNIKYIVFDMYDYNYLNYDVAKSKHLDRYIGWGGYDESSINLELDKINDKVFLEFERKYEYYNYKYPSSRNKYMILDKERYIDFFEKSIYVNQYENTIKKNKSVLSDFVMYCSQHHISVIFIHIPRCRYLENMQINSDYTNYWRTEFYHLMDFFENNYSTSYFDFKNEVRFKNDNYFFDMEHLNLDGAILLTRVLGGIIDSKNAS